MRSCPRVLVTIFCVFAFCVSGAGATEGPGIFSFYLENDIVAQTDRYYTGGMRFSYLSPATCVPGSGDGSALCRLRQWPFLGHPDLAYQWGFDIGQQIFTPANIETAELQKDDRPYAGWTYGGFSLVGRNHHIMRSLKVELGLIGEWSGARSMQTRLHEAFGATRPEGWEHQLENEVGVSVLAGQKWRYHGDFPEHSSELDFIPHVTLQLGNVATRANAGFFLRWGRDLPRDFGSSPISGFAETNAPLDYAYRHNDRWRWHLFTGLNLRLQVHDIFLDGNTFRDSHRVEKEHTVVEGGIGYGFSKGPWKISYGRMFRTNEFTTQKGTETFGSLSVSRVLE